MKLEASSEPTNKDDVIMRSVHGDEVRMPYTFFERLRRYHTAVWPKAPLQTNVTDSKNK